MCLIAYRPLGREAVGRIPGDVIDAALARHPDGFGYAARIDGTLVTATYAPAERAAFRAALVALDASGAEYAAHFRFATSGPKDAAMAHPYTYADPDPAVGTVAVVHNGVLSIAHNRAAESDTSAFVRLVLAELPSRWWTQPVFTYLVGEAIGSSKLVVMTADETAIIGEDYGSWDGDLWYSSSYKPTAALPKWESWSAKRQTAASNPAPLTVVPAPVSRREQRRVNRAAKRAAKRAAHNGSALILATASNEYPTLTHAGHLVSLTGEWSEAGDADLVGGVTCVECSTIGDGYRIDGRWYFDIAHYGPAGGLTLIPATATSGVN